MYGSRKEALKFKKPAVVVRAFNLLGCRFLLLRRHAGDAAGTFPCLRLIPGDVGIFFVGVGGGAAGYR